MAVSSTYPPLADKPWALIAIPLALVAALGIVALLLHSRHRKRHKSRLAVSSDPRVRQALERDLQEAWVRGATGGRTDQPPTSPNRPSRSSQQSASGNQRGGGAGTRWVRPGTTRWAWARDMMQARAEEGLNELGEAPPPYDGRKKRDKLDDDDAEQGRGHPGGGGRPGGGGVELDVLPPNSLPPGPGPPLPPPPLDGQSEPPAYGGEQLRSSSQGDPGEVQRPPTAVLQSVRFA